MSDQYDGFVPADLVLIRGILGNVTDADVERLLDHCTRFERLWVSEPGLGFGVGAHRFREEPRPLLRGARMFDFVGYDVLRVSRTGAGSGG